jgi:endonuclease/exonuclease/phosphatase (EEP) superfamily protein YafD
MIIALSVISYLLVVMVFLPLVRDNFWLFRTLEYPRFQKFILVLSLLATWIAVFFLGKPDFIAMALLSISAVYLFIKIYPYTSISKKEVSTITYKSPNNSMRIITVNVYQENRRYSEMLQEIRSYDPDIIMMVETDSGWAQAMKELEIEYKYSVSEPRANTYGILFYSRLKLREAKINHLVKNDIPSLDAIVELPNGQPVQLYGLHPEPPVPGESLTSTAKDKELMKVAFKVKKCTIPCIVLGDLNDVAWSYTTSLFTKVSGLLDVRCGRGFYSTFSAKNPLLRFPLDYIFCSPDFGLVSMKRLKPAGSDHFPIFTHLVFDARLRAKQKKDDPADQGEINEASEMTAK